jgi:hypothetical protein
MQEVCGVGVAAATVVTDSEDADMNMMVLSGQRLFTVGSIQNRP